jgi:hypothetical protein
VTRVPLLSGTRVAVVDAPPGTAILCPPEPAEGITDVAAAVRDALRFPLSGPPLEALAPRGGTATVLVEPPALPIPGVPRDPRQDAIAATLGELSRAGVPSERQTLLVAGGLARRAGHRELETLVAPDVARRFRGRVVVHDAEDGDLVDLGTADGVPLRVNPGLLAADVVVAVTAAETVLHGGPAALVAAGAPETVQAATAESLLEPGSAAGWRVALALERALAARTALIGVSLAVNHPRLGGVLRGYPYEPEALERVVRSPLRRLYGALPPFARARVLHSVAVEASAAAVFAGPPSVAHAEAMLRAIEARTARLASPLDAICIGIPRVTPYLPRERPNPLLAAHLGLALALRLWRERPPLVPGGTVVLLHRFHRHFSHPTQQPYRAFFAASRSGPDPERLEEAERQAASDARAVDAYRSGRSCHPLLPFVDWAACGPARRQAGAVLIAGCRDAGVARQLGFVPVHSVGAALDMARGRAGGDARLGILVSPPYFPISPEG